MENDEYKNYEDFYDHGPGSEYFKRQLRSKHGEHAPLLFPDFPFTSNPSTTPEVKKAVIQVVLRNNFEPQAEVIVAEVDLNEKYWEVDVPKRKTLRKYIKDLLFEVESN